MSDLTRRNALWLAAGSAVAMAANGRHCQAADPEATASKFTTKSTPVDLTEINPGEFISGPFTVPSSFMGDVFVMKVGGGNQHARFSVAADGNGSFAPGAGWCDLVKAFGPGMKDIGIEFVGTRSWRIRGVTFNVGRLCVTTAGVSE